MRTQVALAGLACFTTLASSATISWTGSGSVNSTSKPYSSCNETTAGPTGPTGTVSVISSSKPYSTCNETTAGPTGPTGPTGTVSIISNSNPYSTCNETTVGPTGATGTGPSGTSVTGTGATGTGPYTNTTTTKQCLATTTVFTVVSAYITTGSFSSTQTFIGSGTIIDGDALTPTDGTATATVTATTTSTIPETTTTTVYTIPATTVGTFLTITVPPPSGFLPIQSTLPNATYHYQNPCNVSTTTSTSTNFYFVGSVSQTVLTGTIIVFSSESTAYEASSFTNYSISYVTSFSATSAYEATATTTTAGGDGVTNTYTATTTTVYQACATNNFADSVVRDHTAVQIDFFEYNTANQTFSGALSNINTPYDCCNHAFSVGADVWTYGIGLGCAVITSTNGVCDPADQGDTAELEPNPQPGSLQFIIGNAQCGRFTKTVDDEF